MLELVDNLANLTGFRDRDVMDTTLVGALREVLHPLSTAVFRSVGEPGNERWLTRAMLMSDDVAASANSAWGDVDELPPVAAFPQRLDCLIGAAVTEVIGQPHITCFPVVTDREVVGVLEVCTNQPLLPEQHRLVGSVLRIYQNFQGLLDYSERDTLTGLLNRKTFDESFLRATAHLPLPVVHCDQRRTTSLGQRHWLAVIDIDHFKRVNDGFGHLIGDEVLLLLARLMRSTFRYHDHLYRFGGEEFVVMMRCNDEADATVALERMRANAERYAFPQVGCITISIGFTEVRAGDTPSAAFERADKAVYHAKNNGRNQVASHLVLVNEGALADEDKSGGIELF